MDNEPLNKRQINLVLQEFFSSVHLEKKMTFNRVLNPGKESGNSLQRQYGSQKVKEHDLLENQLTQDEIQKKLHCLLEQYLGDQRNFGVVMEIAVCYEMLGKVSNAIYFYSWASELADEDKTLGAKLEFLKSKMAELEKLTGLSLTSHESSSRNNSHGTPKLPS